MQNGVKQRRMQTESLRSGVCPLRYCRLDKHLAAASPRRPQAAERRTVFVSTRSQFGVHPGNVDWLRVDWWPWAEFVDAGRIDGKGEQALGMARPRCTHCHAIDPRIDPDRPFAGLAFLADDDL